jgi:hypothetical protein
MLVLVRGVAGQDGYQMPFARQSASAFDSSYRAASVRQMFQPGDGMAEYMASLMEGESALNTLLFEPVRRCRGERLVLVGHVPEGSCRSVSPISYRVRRRQGRGVDSPG